MTTNISPDICFTKYTPKDGHPDFQECLKEALELAEKIRPVILKDGDLTAYQKFKKVKRQISSYSQTVENFFVNRKRYRSGNHSLRPLYAIWTMLNKCNFSCKYCDNHQGNLYPDMPDPDRLDTEKSKRLLEIMRNGTSCLYWCGGEPTMRNDFPELLNHACDLGYFPNIINTNGTLLHKRLQKETWQKFLWQIDIVIMSVDGLNLKRLEELWVTKDAKQVFVNLLLMRELQKDATFKLGVNSVIMPDALDEARDVFDLACDLGVWYVPVPVNVKHSTSKELIDSSKYRDLASTILERKKQGYRIIGSERILKKLLFAEPYECLTTLKPHIWSNGSIAWPCRAVHNMPPNDINLLDYNGFDDAYEAGRKFINPDRFHGPAQNQCGGECAWMQNYTTDRYADSFRSFWKSGIVSELLDFVARNKGS